MALFGQPGHGLKEAGRDMVPAGFAGAFTAFQFRILTDHVLPEIILPQGQLFPIADDFLG